MSNSEATEPISVIEPLGGPLQGDIEVPGDKSISHRAVLFAAMAEGSSQLTGVLDSEDVRASIRAVEALGAQVSLKAQPDGSLAGTVTGWGAEGPSQPDAPIDCGNSGTTARLLMGVVAPWDIKVTITGDESLRKRPMRRIVAPLAKMGVDFLPETPETLPITVCGNRSLRAIDYDSPMASAQLKTAVLLAGVFAEGTTTLNEPAPSRNHTELMLPEFNVPTTAGTRVATVTGPAEMLASDVVVPGDPSSAAFVAAAALLKPGSSVAIRNVSLNPARIGFVRTLERMGADIRESYGGHEGKEPRGTIAVNFTPTLRGCEIPSQHIASVIDEIPVLALVAAHARGITVFHEVGELRVKESDRLQAIIDGLGLIGVDAWVEGDDLFVEGDPALQVPAGLTFESHGDHRLAMTWALVGACGHVPVSVTRFGSVAVSYPDFLTDLKGLVK
ncbi:3-phosphoshikimate 1-carboxyvinyltransferase [Adlercreutzia shanghongiae]|uniref:3-phosphoshikimate 1-carboxyvinyltransferase n=1 Tax=Adlercreutzia shanghongiae TaxID=3111773 RepID=A0ABU6IYL5_9ACTN|nr:3-phosphoshikimate 1-carboxyvinyltransferase [Adlercreutzia sp. R22]MEC4294594.1 3-phosphoshikimate 1-carboxyvinyltransferase [Adlercreutzia sp. R22]